MRVSWQVCIAVGAESAVSTADVILALFMSLACWQCDVSNICGVNYEINLRFKIYSYSIKQCFTVMQNYAYLSGKPRCFGV